MRELGEFPPCMETGFHDWHYVGKGRQVRFCPGNHRRPEIYSIPAKLNMPYAASMTGAKIHVATEAYFLWIPRQRNGTGFHFQPSIADWERWAGNGKKGSPHPTKVQLNVRTACHYPRLIKHALVLGEEHIQEMSELIAGGGERIKRELCHRCFGQDRADAFGRP